MEKNENLVICMYADYEHRLPGGSYDHNCCDCNKPLVVATSTMELIKEKGVTNPGYICLECFQERRIKDIKVVPPSEKQIDEVIKHIIQQN